MSDRLTKIITRKGDDGSTSLDGKTRLPKNAIRLEAIGTLDELNSALGVVLAHLAPSDTDIAEVLSLIQNTLFDVGGELCPPYCAVITSQHVLSLERAAKAWNALLPPLKEFVLPGGNPVSAFCHVARTVCRRAERILVTLHIEKSLNPYVLQYMNRLSDLLFIGARLINKRHEAAETCWRHK